MNNNIPTIRQGASLGITITLDEDLNGKDLYLGFYAQNTHDNKAVVLLSTQTGILKIADNTYHAEILSDKTKMLEVGMYKIEALVKDNNSGLTSISNKDLFLKVEPSNIGKEI